MNVVIIPASGEGKRVGLGMNKVWLPLSGKPIIQHTIEKFLKSPSIEEILVVIRPEDESQLKKLILSIAPQKKISWVFGGETRANSVHQAMEKLPQETTGVLIHDAARPGISSDVIEAVCKALEDNQAVVVAKPVYDTVKKTDINNYIIDTIPRSNLWCASTPQAFSLGLFRQMYAVEDEVLRQVTDDAQLAERIGVHPFVIRDSGENFKVTDKVDYFRMQHIFGGGIPRIGNGYDVHRIKKGRRLILGGVDVLWEYGLEGHSDADVLVHAIMDALLAACGRRDIGVYFPNNDAKWKDVSSLVMLKEVVNEIVADGYTIGNVSSVIIAEAPKLSEYIDDMKKNIANILKIESNHVSIQVTTNESIGCIGRGEGIAALANVVVMERMIR